MGEEGVGGNEILPTPSPARPFVTKGLSGRDVVGVSLVRHVLDIFPRGFESHVSPLVRHGFGPICEQQYALHCPSQMLLRPQRPLVFAQYSSSVLWSTFTTP